MAKRLKELREGRGLTQEGLSEALSNKYSVEISRSSLVNYEVTATYHTKACSNQRMSVENLRCLADFYGVSTDYILGITDTKSSNVTIQKIIDETGLSEKVVERFKEKRKISTPDRNLSADINTIMDNATFDLLLYSIRDYAAASKAEAIYHAVFDYFFPEDIAWKRDTDSRIQEEFNHEIRCIVESRKYGDTVSDYLLAHSRLMSDDTTDSFINALAGWEGLEVSDVCAHKVTKYLTLLLEDMRDNAYNSLNSITFNPSMNGEATQDGND